MIAFDEMGPVSLRPTHGAGWAPAAGPSATAPTYNRRPGIRYVFGAYDVHADRLRLQAAARRRGCDKLAFMRQIRALLPELARRIYWIQDDLSANWTPEIRAFAADNRIELVPTPTYASYLNRIESHFTADQPSSSSRTPTTSTGTPSPTRSPDTSATATATTATAASPSWRPSCGSLRDQSFGCEVGQPTS